MRNLFLVLIILSLQFSIKAQVKLPALVSDNMVLQQNAKVNLWGWASPNEKINIQLGWQNAPVETIADSVGDWKVAINTPQGSEKTYEITINARNKIVLNNVLIGEVWICSGQSNMYFPVGKEEGTWKTGVKNYKEEIVNANYPTIRLFTVLTNASHKPLEDVTGSWAACTPNTIKTFSAVAYFFGRDLYQKLKVPIGLISTSWGGTKAEAWTPQNVLESNTDFLTFWKKMLKTKNYIRKNWKLII